MYFETTIYGEVEIPVADAGIIDFIALCKQRPRLRMEVYRDNLSFLLPLGCVLVDQVEVRVDSSFEINLRRLGNSVRFG